MSPNPLAYHKLSDYFLDVYSLPIPKYLNEFKQIVYELFENGCSDDSPFLASNCSIAQTFTTTNKVNTLKLERNPCGFIFTIIQINGQS